MCVDDVSGLCQCDHMLLYAAEPETRNNLYFCPSATSFPSDSSFSFTGTTFKVVLALRPGKLCTVSYRASSSSRVLGSVLHVGVGAAAGAASACCVEAASAASVVVCTLG